MFALTIALLLSPPPAQITALEVGPALGCVLDAKGQIACWGRNDDGAATGRPGPNASVATRIPLPPARQISVGWSRGCALDSKGAVRCWGRDANAKKILLSDATAIAAADGFACALKADRTVACWGMIGYFQGGPTRVDGLKDVVEIRAAGRRMCARTREGRVACVSSQDNKSPTPVRRWQPWTNARRLFVTYDLVCAEVDGGLKCEGDTAEMPALTVKDLVDLQGGIYHTCALFRSGRATCWGGALPGPSDKSRAPRDLPMTGITRLGVGSAHGCALHAQGTQVSCWGHNHEAQLADGHPTWSPRPVRLDVPTAIELGGDHFCRVTCWGGGTGDASGTYTPMTNATALIPRQACAQNASGFHCWQGHDRVSEPEVEPAMDGAVTGWSSFAVGDNHACGLRGEQVECRGETEYGVLGGPPSADDHGAYHRLDLADVVEVRSAEYFTCARTRVGDVYCWGLLLLMRPPIKPTRLFRKARAIAATDAAVCAEGTDGRIRCVGELGYGSRIKTPTPVEIKPLRGVTGLRGGVHHLCGLRRGAVVCWGENGMGQLGAGHRRETQKAATVRLGTRKAVSVAPFFRHTCALDDAGATWCWGDNRDGVVFKERLVIRRTPQPIVGLR